MKRLLCVLALLPACGGAAFQEKIGDGDGGIDPVATAPEASAPLETSIVRPDGGSSSPEASPPPGDDAATGPEVLAEAAPAPDAPDHPDAGETPDARPQKEAESPPPDAGSPPEASPPDVGPTCTPVTPGGGTCGQSLHVPTPGAYCFEIYSVPTPMVSLKPTPAQCQCAETYNCACILAAGAGSACPSGDTVRCSDSDAGPGVTCL